LDGEEKVMELHRPDLKAEIEMHFNEPMLIGLSVVRCVGYGETADDCYIIAYKPNSTTEELWHSCVGGYAFLDRLREQNLITSNDGEAWNDLVRLQSNLALNGAPPADKFMVKIEHERSFFNGHSFGEI
jgi:hypothetical protein